MTGLGTKGNMEHEKTFQSKLKLSYSKICEHTTCRLHTAIYFFDLEYQETFNIFDNRGDQKVHVWQIGEVLRACGQNPTESEWKKYMGDDPGQYLFTLCALHRCAFEPSHFVSQQRLELCKDSSFPFDM